MKNILYLLIFGICFSFGCSRDEGEESKDSLIKRIESLEKKLDSLGKAVDTLTKNSHPMEAETTVKEAWKTADSVFEKDLSEIKTDWQNEEWTVEQKNEIEKAMDDLIRFRKEVMRKMADQLYMVKQEQTNRINESLEKAQKSLDESRKGGFEALDKIQGETQQMIDNSKANLDAMRKKLEEERDSLLERISDE